MNYDKFRIKTYRDSDGVVKEVCVTCRKKTQVSSDLHVDHRKYYIEGAGQLCDACGKKYANEKI